MSRESELKKLLGDKFEERVKEKIMEFGGYLSRKAAITLIAKEEGIEEDHRIFTPIAEALKSDSFSSVKGTVEKVSAIVGYPSGTRKRTVTVSDESGNGEVNFWGRDAESAGKLMVGDEVELLDLRQKFGVLNFGYKSSIRIIKRSGFTSISELKEGVFNIRGVVQEASDGSIMVRDETGEMKVESGDYIMKLKVGDWIAIQGVEVFGGSARITDRSRVFVKKNRMIEDVVSRAEYKNGVFRIGLKSGKEHKINRKQATKVFGLEGANIPEDALLKVRAEDLNGKKVRIMIKNGEIVEIMG